MDAVLRVLLVSPPAGGDVAARVSVPLYDNLKEKKKPTGGAEGWRTQPFHAPSSSRDVDRSGVDDETRRMLIVGADLRSVSDGAQRAADSPGSLSPATHGCRSHPKPAPNWVGEQPGEERDITGNLRCSRGGGGALIHGAAEKIHLLS